MAKKNTFFFQSNIFSSVCIDEYIFIPEASSTMRVPQGVLVSVIITSLNDSERSLNKKCLAQ